MHSQRATQEATGREPADEALAVHTSNERTSGIEDVDTGYDADDEAGETISTAETDFDADDEAEDEITGIDGDAMEVDEDTLA